MRIGAIEQVGRLGLKELLPLLLRLVPTADDRTMLALAHAFGSLGDPAAEDVLVSRLEEADSDVLIPIIRALGLVASASTVETLRPLSRGLSRSGDVKDAAQDAIDRIQSRLSGADEGQVSIVDLPADSGTLSLSDAQGALSEPPARQPPARKPAEDAGGERQGK